MSSLSSYQSAVGRNAMTSGQFAHLLCALCQATWDLYTPTEDTPQVVFQQAMDVASHQMACLFAQRYDEDVPTEMPFGFLELHQSPLPDDLYDRCVRLVWAFESEGAGIRWHEASQKPNDDSTKGESA